MLQRWHSKLSLRTKATAITAIITTVSLAAVATLGVVQIRIQIDAEQRRAADSIALSIARASELSLAVHDSRELSRLINSFLRDEHVMFIAVYANGVQPLASAIRDRGEWETFSRTLGESERCVVARSAVETLDTPSDFTDGLDVDLTTAAKPAMGAARTLGHVVVGLSSEQGLAAWKRQSRLTLVVTGSAAVIGTLILCITLGAWTRRLQRISDASQSISRGDFSGAIVDKHQDEIGRLAASFDQMRLALSERDARLCGFTETLREQVRQRTAELEKALSTAEEASRAKSLFLANMSHELRTPLNGVIGMVDLLLATEPNAQQRRYCDVAKTSAHSLLELINDILDFSKIEAGKLELDATDFNLHELVEGVTQMLGERAEKKKLELLCGVRPDVPRLVNGDPVRLRQVILNLISNALKFTEAGEVVIDVGVQEQCDTHATVRFTIRDTGIGIPRERLDRLFKSFSQVDTSTTRKFGGTGLGLAISQRIVEMMGGQISVSSEPGRGATFTFTARFEKRAAPLSAAPESNVDPRGLRVLAVDDNLTNREIIQAQLSSWSLRADVADCAEKAMEMLLAAVRQGDPYRFAILDIRMPRIDGVELAHQIKADPLICDVILISLSSLSHSFKPRQMMQAGFAVCLTKPALPSQLYNAIIDSLAASRQSASCAVPLTAARSGALRLPGLRALVAEDNEVNRLVASELLGQAGCQCIMAVNGREALDAALAESFDVILMDCQMPEMDGFEATQKIRAAEQSAGDGKRRLIIALTANAIKGDRERCLAAGMDGYVTKPIDPPTLFTTIWSLLPAGRLAPQALQADALRVACMSDTQVGESKSASADDDADGPPVNLQALRQRCLGNRKIAAKALGTFQNTTLQDLPALVASVQKGDAKLAASSAHKIKGAAANVSAEGIRQVAAQIEELARADAMSQATSCLEQLEREVGRFRDYLSTALVELSPIAGEVQTEARRNG